MNGNMKNRFNRRNFIKNTGLVAAVGMITSPLMAAPGRPFRTGNQNVTVTTDFVNGGGTPQIISLDPVTIRFQPHNQNNGDWSQVWWHFRVDGFEPGEEIVLELDRGNPRSAGVSPQACFSYDQQVWGKTDTGKPITIEGREAFLYKHRVRGKTVWFAYDIPYVPDDIEALLAPARRDPGVKVFELCKTARGRSVPAMVFGEDHNNTKKAGIWLQARAHAFESGASWVLHELALWLLSDDAAARALRANATLYVVPLVDVDSVVEGRTGKNQPPYDHNRGWHENPNQWPETTVTQSMINELKRKNRFDMFIDFHGPGGWTHPYFIVAAEEDLKPKQRVNRAKFYEVLKARPIDDEAKKRQSMTEFYYSPRPLKMDDLSSACWLTLNGNEHTVAMTLEVNMGTPLSTREGYRAEGVAMGKALAKYFADNLHKR